MRLTPRRAVILLTTLFFLCIFLWTFLRGTNVVNSRRMRRLPVPGELHLKRKFVSNKSEQTDWQTVPDSKYLFSIYSAYILLPSYEPEVLVIGVTKRYSREKVLCQFHFRKKDAYLDLTAESEIEALEKLQFPGKLETMEEHRVLNYSGAFIRCPKPSDWAKHRIQVENVSILIPSEDVEEVPSNMIKIQYKYETDIENEPPEYRFNFSVCVLPTYDYNQPFRFIQWLEFYKMMGVEQFTFYNVSIGPDVSCILNELLEGSDPSIKVNVHPWHKNPVKWVDLITAGANDCVYRHRGRDSKYMIFVNLDEYLMPLQSDSFSQLIRQLDSDSENRNIAQYVFVNGSLFPSLPNDPNLLERCSSFSNIPLEYRICQESLMTKKMTRDSNNYPFRTSIVKPEGVKEAGNDFAWTWTLQQTFASVKVPAEVAFLPRYGASAGMGTHSNNTDQAHRIPLKFGFDLVGNISSKVEYFMDQCKINMDMII